jgi:threonine synthase
VKLAQTADTKIDIAQPEGCSPIAQAILGGASEIDPQTPTTQAHSLAIGAPGDGVFVIEAVRSRQGTAATVSDREIFAGIDLLAATEGILTEPAGGTTVAVVKKLAEQGRLDPDEVIVAMITGNGLKTLYEHPSKPWPSKVACDPETMRGVLEGFQHEAGVATASHG